MSVPPTLVDTHAHLASSKLTSDLEQVIARAIGAGVRQIVSIGTSLGDASRTLEIATAYSDVFAAVGIHPNDAAEAGVEDWSMIESLARNPQVVAIGETGLDRYWDRTPFPVQQDYFDRHLDLAEVLDLPVVIHSRDCQADVIAQISRRAASVRGIQHSFTGTWDEAQALLELGLHISFAGMITFENKALDPLREVAARIPLHRLLVETDSPYLSPHPFRGKRNEPSRTAITAASIAKIRGTSLEDIASATTENARRLFRLPEQSV